MFFWVWIFYIFSMRCPFALLSVDVCYYIHIQRCQYGWTYDCICYVLKLYHISSKVVCLVICHSRNRLVNLTKIDLLNHRPSETNRIYLWAMNPRNNCNLDLLKVAVFYFVFISIFFFVWGHSCIDLNLTDRKIVWPASDI